MSAAPTSKRSASGSDDDESGEDLIKKNSNNPIVGEDDSSEEESDDDPEEARRIAQGFIVDEEDEEDSQDDESEKKKKRRRRKEKKRRRREELRGKMRQGDQETREGEEGEEEGENRRKRDRENREEELDEDDLDLVAENTGQKRKGDEHRLKRFRRGSASASPPPSKKQDLARIFDDEEDAIRVQRRPNHNRSMGYDEDDEEGSDEDLPSVADAIRSNNPMKIGSSSKKDKASSGNNLGIEEDDVDDFIDDDDDDSQNDSLDEETGERRKKKKKNRSSSGNVGLNGVDGRGGIDREAWEELNDLFGDGQDYDWAMRPEKGPGDQDGPEEEEEDGMDIDADDEDEEDEKDEDEDEEATQSRKEKKKKGKKSGVSYKDIFEPAQIAEGMLTLEDDRIRRSDLPERYQLALPGDDGLALLERQLSSSELDAAAKWVGPRISTRCTEAFLKPSGPHFHRSKDWYDCVKNMLHHSLNQSLEAPYLYQHKYDELEFDFYEADASGTKKRFDYLVRRELAFLVHLGLKFKLLLRRKEQLKKTFENLIEELDEFKEEDGLDGQNSDLTEEQIERKQQKKDNLEKEKREFYSIWESSSSAEEISDLTEWLVMKYGQRMRDAQASTSSGYNLSDDLDSTLSISSKPPVFKKPSILGVYEQTKNSIISKLAQRIGITPSELASNVTSVSGSRNHFPDDESSSPEVLSSEYESEEWHTPGAPLQAAQMLLANEIGKHPIMKREARTLFKETAQINVNPTDRGSVKIDNQHPFFNFKFLKDKPVSAFLNPPIVLDANGANVGMSASASAAQWIQILQAENDLLVNLDISLPDATLKGLIARLFTNYNGEGTSEAAIRWNEVRKEIIEQAVKNYLIPNAKNWLREWLKEECIDAIAKSAETNLVKRIHCAPYRSTSMKAKAERKAVEEDSDSEDEENLADENIPRVLAVSHGSGDARKGESIVSVFLDSHSRFRHHAVYNHLRPAEKTNEEEGEDFDSYTRKNEEIVDPRAEFIEMIKERRPDVIVVNGFSHKTVALTGQLHEISNQVTEDLIKEAQEENGGQELTDAQKNEFKIDVIHCHDDIARLYQHSSRAADEYPELATLGRYCVGLARYVQNPVLEFCSLKQDITSVLLDPNQRLVPEERLREVLERSLVAFVCEAGVDINRAVSDNYYSNLLPYVAGLGPRKANALIRSINRELEGTVVSRNALLEPKPLLHFTVWTNCISFLKIVGEYESQGIVDQGPPDALDATRIHPEDYDYPRKMAADALNKDEEDLEDVHPSQPCKELMETKEASKKLRELDLESYAEMLYKLRGLRKKNTLNMCLRELAKPYKDYRPDFILPTDDDMLTMLTGETSKSLDWNRIVPVTVVAIVPTHLIVRLDSGMEGTINAQYYREDIPWGDPTERRKLRDYAAIGKCFDAMIIDMDKKNLRVELTALEKHLQEVSVVRSNETATDPVYFDRSKADDEDKQALEKAQKIKNRQVTRNIKHPNFRNFRAGQAEEYLAGQPRGSVVIRPSSKGNDHLAVTWKVDDGVYQHLDVQELNKENDYALGKNLRIANEATYNDLDELIVDYINPMAKMVDMMMHHEKYQGSDPEKLVNYLTTWTAANPRRSIYAFGLDRERPGYFKLSFKANREAPIETWPVKVKPGAFKLNKAEELPDVMSLCNSFKAQYTSLAMAASGAGSLRTPAIGGSRTPHAAGGMTPGRTPGYMTPGRTPGHLTPGMSGRYTPQVTPNAYMAQQTPQIYPGQGQTPNPYVGTPNYGGMTPGRMTPGRAPGPAPGPPPSRPPQIHPDRLAQLNNARGGW